MTYIKTTGFGPVCIFIWISFLPFLSRLTLFRRDLLFLQSLNALFYLFDPIYFVLVCVLWSLSSICYFTSDWCHFPSVSWRTHLKRIFPPRQLQSISTLLMPGSSSVWQNNVWGYNPLSHPFRRFHVHELLRMTLHNCFTFVFSQLFISYID